MSRENTENNEDTRPSEDGALTYEQIILRQINVCRIEGSKEMVGGYLKETTTPQGLKEIYIPDQKQIYIQSVKVLHDLLLPHFDTKMEEVLELFEKELEDAKESKIAILRDIFVETKDPKEKRKLKTQIDSGFIDRDNLLAKQFGEEQVEIYRNLFQELVLLYNRVNLE